jgi:hypothetical protein
MRKLYKSSDQVVSVKSRCLEFLEHMVGMDQTRVDKKNFKVRLVGSRKPGRPELE